MSNELKEIILTHYRLDREIAELALELYKRGMRK